KWKLERFSNPEAGGQKPRLNEAIYVLLHQLVRHHPDLTLQELYTYIAAETGVGVSVPTVGRVLQRLGLPRKKVAPCARARYSARPAGTGGLSGANRATVW
ncbi:MAG TPA: winged helix-turn-helix domain-containing protein, partial [Candidatus Tectomicrobia bacterium]|nr:winged helix-turn-helix domain-containing protein [Candidatus Tectomicrobia bacterium]